MSTVRAASRVIVPILFVCPIVSAGEKYAGSDEAQPVDAYRCDTC